MAFTPEELSAAAEAYERLGSQKKAAKELGLTRRSLQRRLYAFKHDNDQLSREAEEFGFDPEKVDHHWIKTKNGSYHVRRDTQVDYNQLRDNFIEEANNHAPKYTSNSGFWNYILDKEHLLVIDIADIHFGKLSLKEETRKEYNLEIAEERMRKGVFELVNKAKPFGIEKIVFVIGNDALHIDGPMRKTTAGTPQDTDGQWWSAYNVAKKAYIAAIEELTVVAPVHLVFNPSNHDYASGFMLADSIASWFHNHPDVNSEDASMSIAHRKYIQYGSNLLGFTHGDGAKESDLPNLMQYEARQVWGQTKYGYWHTHHLHIKDRKVYGKQNYRVERDHIGITVINSGKLRDPENSIYVEVVRSPSATDAWHDRNGYIGNAAVECFLYHVDRGQTARFTHNF